MKLNFYYIWLCQINSITFYFIFTHKSKCWGKYYGCPPKNWDWLPYKFYDVKFKKIKETSMGKSILHIGLDVDNKNFPQLGSGLT